MLVVTNRKLYKLFSPFKVIMEYCLYCTKDLAHGLLNEGLIIDTSTNTAPFAVFSPFFVWDQVIPVPGQDGLKSKTIEGVWQGLKLIDGKIDKSYFGAEKIRKRKIQPYGSALFLYGENRIDYLTAREKIYKPTFEWVYRNLLPGQLKKALYILARGGIKLFFYDVDSNPDIEDVSSPYSHSSLLVDIINEELRIQDLRTDCSTK